MLDHCESKFCLKLSRILIVGTRATLKQQRAHPIIVQKLKNLYLRRFLFFICTMINVNKAQTDYVIHK